MGLVVDEGKGTFYSANFRTDKTLHGNRGKFVRELKHDFRAKGAHVYEF